MLAASTPGAREPTPVRLPVPAASPVAAIVDGMVGSVLIVDDDDAFRDLAARVLSARGFDVAGQANSCASAIASAEALRPEAALVDVNLPDGDGFELSRKLTALPWSMRVVIISGDADAGAGDAVSRAGAAGFLGKDELASERLRNLLSGESGPRPG